MSGAVLEARGWGWRHASRRAWALQDLDLRIEAGERVLLLGASGAGKSTLLQGMAGLLGGEEDGESTGTLTVDAAPASAARGRVGMVLQDPDAQVILSRVGDDVAFGCENLGVPRPQIWERVPAALAAVGLHVPLDRPTKHLSGGQKQRLALAGVAAMRPGAILLDEPTANLDPDGVAEVRDAVAELLASTDATLVVVEHRVEVWASLVTRIVVLGAEGGVLADGSPDEVLGARGAELAAAGVWVPGHPPAMPPGPASAPGAEMLRACGLTVSRDGRTSVAEDIDLSVRAGQATAITGANGTGKSTLGLTIAGLLAPRAGEVRASDALAAGADRLPGRWSSRQMLTRIGMVFQSPEHQLLARTVRSELEIGLRALGYEDARVRARGDELLARLRLERLAEANPFTLSGGEKRRLTVAASLAGAPRVLVLDEPTYGQDARTWAELVALLASLRDEGSAIVTVTHDLDVVRALGAERFVLGVPGAPR